MPNDRIRAKMNIPNKLFYKKIKKEYGDMLPLSVYLLAHLGYRKFKKRAISIYRNRNYTSLKKIFANYKGDYAPKELAPNDRREREMI